MNCKSILLGIALVLSSLNGFTQSGEQNYFTAEIGAIFNPDKTDTSGVIGIGVSFKNGTSQDIYISQTPEFLFSKNNKMLSLYKDGVLLKELDEKYYSGRPVAQLDQPPLPKGVIAQSSNPVSLERMSETAQGRLFKYIIDSVAIKNRKANDLIVSSFLADNGKTIGSDSIRLRTTLKSDYLFLKANRIYKNYFVVLLETSKLSAGSYELRYEPSLSVTNEKYPSLNKISGFTKIVPSSIPCKPIYFTIP